MSLIDRLNLAVPIIQAPMAGVSTAKLAAEVSNAGGLGSIAVGAMDVRQAERAISEVKSLTDLPFNVNTFVHATPQPDYCKEQAWLAWLEPEFVRLAAEVPKSLKPLYKSLHDDPDMLNLLEDAAPAVVSFHFGLPTAAIIERLHSRGCYLVATATNQREAQAIEAAGLDAIIAQGIEAGGHRGVFDPAAPDDELTTHVLTRLIVNQTELPVIAAGGIMDGAGVAAALSLGAQAAQLGTAFIGCSESAADDVYRARLHTARQTRITSVVSGRPARILATEFAERIDADGRPAMPAYPIAYDAGKSLSVAARTAGVDGFGVFWAGQGVSCLRAMRAADLVQVLAAEANL
jgi:nitronate monooxygenase